MACKRSLAAAGYPCEHVDVASPSVLARGAVDEATADCAGENLDIAVFPTAEQADEYGRQGGYPYATGDGWVIITETLTMAERIANALGGTTGYPPPYGNAGWMSYGSGRSRPLRSCIHASAFDAGAVVG